MKAGIFYPANDSTEPLSLSDAVELIKAEERFDKDCGMEEETKNRGDIMGAQIWFGGTSSTIYNVEKPQTSEESPGIYIYQTVANRGDAAGECTVELDCYIENIDGETLEIPDEALPLPRKQTLTVKPIQMKKSLRDKAQAYFLVDFSKLRDLGLQIKGMFFFTVTITPKGGTPLHRHRFLSIW